MRKDWKSSADGSSKQQAGRKGSNERQGLMRRLFGCGFVVFYGFAHQGFEKENAEGPVQGEKGPIYERGEGIR